MWKVSKTSFINVIRDFSDGSKWRLSCLCITVTLTFLRGTAQMRSSAWRIALLRVRHSAHGSNVDEWRRFCPAPPHEFIIRYTGSMFWRFFVWKTLCGNLQRSETSWEGGRVHSCKTINFNIFYWKSMCFVDIFPFAEKIPNYIL